MMKASAWTMVIALVAMLAAGTVDAAKDTDAAAVVLGEADDVAASNATDASLLLTGNATERETRKLQYTSWGGSSWDNWNYNNDYSNTNLKGKWEGPWGGSYEWEYGQEQGSTSASSSSGSSYGYGGGGGGSGGYSCSCGGCSNWGYNTAASGYCAPSGVFCYFDNQYDSYNCGGAQKGVDSGKWLRCC
mmetsp:Transcript_13641/g.34281  ORF Transcript_13641/g.34281 Transcript_13641/m.34281 type:complete len:189 (+) Transcript_13641:260-826(+)